VSAIAVNFVPTGMIVIRQVSLPAVAMMAGMTVDLEDSSGTGPGAGGAVSAQ
jgi:hypothetical protein